MTSTSAQPAATDTRPSGRPSPLATAWNLLRRYRTLAVVVLLLVLPLVVPYTEQYDAALWTSTAIMALSVVAVTGASGQVTLGQAGLMAVGAYGAAIASIKINLPQPLPLLVALAAATLVGTLLAFACLRLHGIYLAVVTLAFGWAIPELVLKLQSLTNGYQGLYPNQLMLGSTSLNTGLPGIYFGIVGVIIAFVLVRNLLSHWSRLNVLAVKQSEILARSFGVRPARQRLWAFAVSSFLAGLAGYIYCYTVGAVDPSSFSFNNSVMFLAAAVIGGVVSPIGALIGAVFVTFVPHLLANHAQVASLVYGVLLFLAITMRSLVSRIHLPARRLLGSPREGNR